MRTLHIIHYVLSCAHKNICTGSFHTQKIIKSQGHLKYLMITRQSAVHKIIHFCSQDYLLITRFPHAHRIIKSCAQDNLVITRATLLSCVQEKILFLQDNYIVQRI